MNNVVDGSEVLQLKVQNFQSQAQWDLVLTTSDGDFLDDHEVRLDPESLEYKAMARLQFYARSRADPKRPIESEKEFLGHVGRWMGEKVFGDIGRRLVEWRPITAIVMMPPDSEELCYWPFELAWVGEQPIALQGVSLLFDVSGSTQGSRREKVAIAERLRILAVFSLPAEEPLLLLSQQRYELVRSIELAAASKGKNVSLVTAQHGVTRRRLGEFLNQGEGWDVIHFSGHGLAARLLLEDDSGQPDPISTDELLQMLLFARIRLKLLVLSSCESGAAACNEAIRVCAPTAERGTSENLDDSKPLAALAVEAARQLDCAVLGMRYRVSDDFSIALTHHLYDNLINKENPLPQALQLALPEALEHWPEPGKPPLSVATPALFGRRGANLVLKSPAAKLNFGLGGLKMSYFGREPELFVGRVEPMAAASRVLAPDDRFSGILFHAAGPTGKTACAVELAYLYQDQFTRLVRYQAPTDRKKIEGSLIELAERLETQLGQFDPAMKQAVQSRTELEKFLPKLKEFMEKNAILVFIDGIEGLLTTEGNWRDDKWRLVVNALLDDNRVSRLVLTSRQLPTALHDRLRVIQVPPLSPEEALLLARQLPHFGAVLRGHTNLVMTQAAPLLANALAAAGGIPEIICEADKQLTSPSVLIELPARISELANAVGVYDRNIGRSEEYLHLIHEWTRGIQQSLDAPKQQDSAGSAIYAPSTDVSIDSESTMQGSVAQSQNPNETDAIYKRLKMTPGNEVRLSRRQHQSISEIDNRQISDALIPEAARSHKSEGGLKVPELSVLPGAIEYHSGLSRILIELNTLYSVPEFPRRLTGKSVFKWQFLTTTWLAKAERVLTEATAIAAVRESGGYPSPRLAHATADAKAGLAWIRNLVANNGESSESSQFLRHCEETVSAISEVAAYAAGS